MSDLISGLISAWREAQRHVVNMNDSSYRNKQVFALRLIREIQTVDDVKTFLAFLLEAENGNN